MANTNTKKTMPAIFFGHGNPMNALLDNDYSRRWAYIGTKLSKPKAILCISAHWYVSSTMVTAMSEPRTIHDFRGFPKELYKVMYPAKGDLDLAKQVKELLSPTSVGLDKEWGLDHGSWSVLIRVFPKFDIPVVQLSIDKSKPASFHYELAKKLAPLRDEGVLIIGSGNIVHNLASYSWDEQVKPGDLGVRFERQVRDLLTAKKDEQLIEYEKLGSGAAFSIPTPDHYLPLLYVIALRRKGEQVSFPVEGFDGGSISMLSVQLG
jgi:4,5-DOPA dioxygenase extradiol